MYKSYNVQADEAGKAPILYQNGEGQNDHFQVFYALYNELFPLKKFMRVQNYNFFCAHTGQINNSS